MSWLMRGQPPEGSVPMTQQVPSVGTQFVAGVRHIYAETDSWNRTRSHARALRGEILEALGPRAPDLVREWAQSSPTGWQDFEDFQTRRLMEVAAEAAQEDPGSWGGIPTTHDAYLAELTRRRTLELEEQEGIIERGHNRWASFLGQMAGAATDEVSLATMPLGFGFARGGWKAGRFVLGEMGIGAASEAVILPRMADVAEELGRPSPNWMAQMTLGAAGSGALAGTVVAGARGLQYLRDGRSLERQSVPPGTDPLQARADINAAEIDLRTGTEGMTPTGAIATQRGGLDTAASSLLGTSGAEGNMRAMLRMADGTRVSGLGVGDTLPDGGRIVSIEMGRITVDRDGQQISAGVGEAVGGSGVSPTPTARPTSPEAEAGSPLARFDFSPGASAGADTNPVGYVFGRLLELGYEPRVAAAFVGNMMQESGPGLNTRAVGDGGNAFGMAQWNGPRRRQYLAYARQLGADPGDIDTQIAFFHLELQTTERAALRAILDAPDAVSAARVASERFWRPGIPHLEARMGYARALFDQFEAGGVPVGGRPAPVGRTRGATTASTEADFDFGAPDPRRAGMTRFNEVSSPAGTRVEVEWEVADLASLRSAAGDLQPRDRSRAASDEQINQIAAGLDPARLLPAPEGDRGAPIVGRDGIVESGNARVAALRRAADRHPERYKAYVERLQAEGFEVPEGVEQPVLIGRRPGDMSLEARQAWVRENNTSAIARMGGSEQARMDAGYLTPSAMDALHPTSPLGSPENGEFIRRVLAGMPQTERAAFYTGDGALSQAGARQIEAALFSRAWGADDLVRLLVESPAPEMRALVEMLQRLAPEWAAFRDMIDAGMIRAEFDITAPVVGMVRIIAKSRGAKRDGQSVISAIRDFLATPDMLNPRDDAMNAALLDVFYPKDVARLPAATEHLLRRYVADATLAGRADSADLFAAPPSPRDVLASVTRAQDKGDPMPSPPERPATQEGAPQTEPVPLPASDQGALSPVLARMADSTEADLRASDDAPSVRATAASPPEAPTAPARADAEVSEPVAVSAADYVALRDFTFRHDTEGPELRLRDFLRDLDADADLTAAMSACVRR